MVSLLFFILAANNVIKVVRDSLFLSRFPISDLAYVYLLAAVIAGVIISGYTRYTVRMPLYRFILVSNAFIISNVILFWFLIVFFNRYGLIPRSLLRLRYSGSYEPLYS